MHELLEREAGRSLRHFGSPPHPHTMLCIQRLRDPCRTKLPVHSAANLWMGALRKGCAQQASAHAPTLRTRLARASGRAGSAARQNNLPSELKRQKGRQFQQFQLAFWILQSGKVWLHILDSSFNEAIVVHHEC